ncbi:dipeptidase [uncultured Brevundimonas sp.]|uniref:dipeptidase n=1 Tax=uncultured Brevundimonas sp. TaxID=213418 RepID=UPI00260E5883|nr:dipeptidase [uncultured Brevundimonas sp.]
MMRKLLMVAVAATALLPAVAAQAQTAAAGDNAATEAHVRQILRRTPLIDGHNDLPWAFRQGFGNDVHGVDLTTDLSMSTRLHTDIPRLREGGVGAQFWSVYVSANMSQLEAAKATFEQVDTVKRIVSGYPQTFEIATTADDIVRIHRQGKIASLIGMEGGYSIDDSLGLLREFRRAGALYMTLTHSKSTNWADAGTDAPKWGGLNAFGEEVVKEMNRIGMMVDLSHTSAETMRDALRVTEAPVIFSHSSALGVTAHPRNVPDDVLAAMKDNGGIVMVTFVPGFISEQVRAWGANRAAEQARLNSLHPGDPDRVKRELEQWVAANPTPRATIDDVVAHIQYVRDKAGIDHIGLGGDFDGVDSLPVGVEAVDAYPRIMARLIQNGWTDSDIRKLSGENMLRVMRQVEAVAARKQNERPNLSRLPRE